MGLKTFTIRIIVLSLLATAALGPAAFLCVQGDVNGDGRVDVLDAQLLVAQVVKSPDACASPRADANQDGQINVLDLQYTLARVNGAETENKPAPAKDPSPKCTVTSFHGLGGPLVRLTGMLEPATVHPRMARLLSGPPRVLPSSTQRYLFTLTPHAPPVLS